MGMLARLFNVPSRILPKTNIPRGSKYPGPSLIPVSLIHSGTEFTGQATWKGRFMGHRRDVYGGNLRAGAASGSGRRTEPSIGGAGVWCLSQDDSEDADVLGSAGLPATTADTAAQVGAVAGRHRCHS